MKVTYKPSFYEGLYTFEDIQYEPERSMFAAWCQSSPESKRSHKQFRKYIITKYCGMFFLYDHFSTPGPTWWHITNITECLFIKLPRISKIYPKEYYIHDEKKHEVHGPFQILDVLSSALGDIL